MIKANIKTTIEIRVGDQKLTLQIPDYQDDLLAEAIPSGLVVVGIDDLRIYVNDEDVTHKATQTSSECSLSQENYIAFNMADSRLYMCVPRSHLLSVVSLFKSVPASVQPEFQLLVDPKETEVDASLYRHCIDMLYRANFGGDHLMHSAMIPDFDRPEPIYSLETLPF